MTDVLTPEQRRLCMSRVKCRNTTPEIALRKALWADKIRYRLKSNLFGKPDLVFVGPRVAVFIDGCFWHGCPLHAQQPKTNIEFWNNKIKKNIERDAYVNTVLQNQGWHVVRCWQHEVKKDLHGCVDRVKTALSLTKMNNRVPRGLSCNGAPIKATKS